jgi:squalene-hopene/tetraprenyl-beta-curcumene cyclase
MNFTKKFLMLMIGLSTFSLLHSQDGGLLSTGPEIPETVLREAYASMRRGVDYLIEKQKKDGSWIHHPAVSGLCVMALHNSGAALEDKRSNEAVQKGLDFIRKFVQKDGSIWLKGQKREYPNYTTAVALCAIATVNDPKDEPIMRAARKYLINSQITDKDNVNFGGIGYGKEGPENSDLSNTQWALEALYLTNYLDKEPKAKSPEDTKKSKLAWKNAVQFLTKLQHVSETNDAVWVVKDKNDPNHGSFVYKNDESKDSKKEGEEKGLKGYAGMTYAGMKSMIYAKLKKDDPRVKAALEWGAKHYDLTTNPGIGSEGHYYYLNTFAKARSILGGDILTTADGKKHNWRVDLIKQLLKTQKGKGEWYNDNGRWWENVPELVTAYSLISMESALVPKIQR